MTIEFGAFAPKPSEQIEGLDERFDEYADAIVRLGIMGLLTETEVHRARMRLLKQIKVAMSKEERS